MGKEIEYSDYLDKKGSASLGEKIKTKDEQKCKEALSNTKCVDTKSLLFTSLITGLVGGDRYYLGDKKLGIIKSVTFLSIVISFFAVVGVISQRVAESIEGFAGAVTITWADNVAIAGEGLGIATYALVACLAVYVVLVIVDAVICRKKAQKANLATMLQVVDNVD